MSLAEYRAHYSVWSILASPLLLSADLRSLEDDHPECLDLLLNADIVAVNQDEGGHAPRLLRQEMRQPATPEHLDNTTGTGATPLLDPRLGPHGAKPQPTDVLVQVFARPLGEQPNLALEGGEWAVLLLNRDEHAREIAVSWKELGVDDATLPLHVFDIISRKHLQSAVQGRYSALVSSHDVAFVRLTHAVRSQFTI